MHMPDGDILMEYKLAKDRKEMIRILADQNLIKPSEMAQWLYDHGAEIDKRMLHKGIPRKKEEQVKTEVTEVTEVTEHGAKYDDGKPQLTLVPTGIMFEIAKVRMYGCKKYPEGGKNNWMTVEPERHFEACLRHMYKAFSDLRKMDPESGLMHLSHAACDLSFVIEQLTKEES